MRRKMEWFALILCDCEDGSACYSTGLVRCGPFASLSDAEACARANGGEVTR